MEAPRPGGYAMSGLSYQETAAEFLCPVCWPPWFRHHATCCPSSHAPSQALAGLWPVSTGRGSRTSKGVCDALDSSDDNVSDVDGGCVAGGCVPRPRGVRVPDHVGQPGKRQQSVPATAWDRHGRRRQRVMWPTAGSIRSRSSARPGRSSASGAAPDPATASSAARVTSRSTAPACTSSTTATTGSRSSARPGPT